MDPDTDPDLQKKVHLRPLEETGFMQKFTILVKNSIFNKFVDVDFNYNNSFSNCQTKNT